MYSCAEADSSLQQDGPAVYNKFVSVYKRTRARAQTALPSFHASVLYVARQIWQCSGMALPLIKLRVIIAIPQRAACCGDVVRGLGAHGGCTACNQRKGELRNYDFE